MLAQFVVATLSLVAPQFDAPAPEWQRIPSGLFENWTDEFEKAGFDPFEANRLAHLLVFGTDPSGQFEAGSASSGCSYYLMTTWYCVGNNRFYERKAVGAVCVEAAIGTCLVVTCPPGERSFFKLTTSATCNPASTCSWISVSGPHTSDNPGLCSTLSDCSCWPGLDCTVAVCVKVAGSSNHPSGCPSCP
jgi:hypothetical protein